MKNIQKTYALIIGIILLLFGVWGFLLPGGLGNIGMFSVNYLQSALNVLAGLFGLYAGTKGTGRGFNMVIGWIVILLAILGFLPGTDLILVSYLNINFSLSIMHMILGIASLAVYHTVERKSKSRKK